MKELNSPFKKLIGYNRFSKIFFIAAAVSVVTCKSRAPVVSGGDSSRDVGHDNAIPLISLSDSIRESWFELRAQSAPTTLTPLRVSAKSCVDRKFVFGTTLKVLGQNFEVAFEEDDDQLALALVEDTETKLTGITISNAIKDQICSDSRSSNQGWIAVDGKQLLDLQSALTTALAKMTPDCKEIKFETDKAVCRLDSLMPQAALVRTEEFQKAMIRKWSRQPYILARRTGVVATLARAASNVADDGAFNKFCKVLQFSLPEELPIVMTSRRWQSALCSASTNNRREAAFYGLAKGAEELDMLRELYEDTSRVGVLSVKIPGESIPGPFGSVARQPLRVIISPNQEVSQKLVDQAKKYLGRTEREDRPRRFLRKKRGSKQKRVYEVARVPKDLPVASTVQTLEMCWHPVFGEGYGLLRTADGMKLTGKGFSLECGYVEGRNPGSEADVAALSKYLLQSLSSEAEFVLDNGQSKLLRLPEGHYRYTVQLLPENPLDSEAIDEENVPKTSGELSWSTTRRHLIRTW